MADTATTFSTLSNDAPNVWIAREMYRLAERNLRLGKYAKAHQLPQRMSKTMRIVRYKRLNLPTATLTEGTAPDAVALATENVDVTVEQWGIVVLLTDVAEITTVHPALQIAINRTALAIAETLEREMAVMLLSGTTVSYPGSATSRATIGATDKIDTATVLKTTVTLRDNGAAEREGGLFAGVMPPQMEGDLLSSDASFKDASNFANVRALQFGEIGIWMGTRWARSNFLPKFEGVAAPTSAAATAKLTQFNPTGGTGGVTHDGRKVQVVARSITTDFEHRISQLSAAASSSDDEVITLPSSANYTYDVYVTNTSGASPLKVVSRAPASATGTLAQAVAGSGGFTGAGARVAYASATVAPPAAPADGREVFTAFITGEDGYGRVELNGMSLQSYITPPGASYSNPLAQGRKVGTKIMWKSFKIADEFFARIEAASAYSAGLAA